LQFTAISDSDNIIVSAERHDLRDHRQEATTALVFRGVAKNRWKETKPAQVEGKPPNL